MDEGLAGKLMPHLLSSLQVNSKYGKNPPILTGVYKVVLFKTKNQDYDEPETTSKKSKEEDLDTYKSWSD